MPLAALAQELRGREVLARLADPLDASASVRYSLGRTLSALTPVQRARFAALGLPEGPDWALPLIERLLAGVPAAGAARDGAEEGAPADLPGARADLEALVAYSLVGLVAGEDVGEESTLRVRLHPLVRELAREEWARLPEAAQEAALGALLAGVRGWLARHQRLGASDIETLALDEDLIAGALREAAARHVELPQVIAIVEAWVDYLYVRNLPLRREMAGLRLECARRIGDRRAEIAALRHLAGPNGLEWQQDEAAAYRQAALAIARELGDQLEVLDLLCLLGGSAASAGMRAEAARMYEDASVVVRQMGDHLTDAGVLGSLGEYTRTLGRFEEAGRWYQRALESHRAAGDILGENITRANMGVLYEQMGDTAAAQRRYEDVLAYSRLSGNRLGMDVMLNLLGQLALRAGDLETAARDLTEALPNLEQSGLTLLAVHARGNLAILAGLKAQRRGDREAAAQAFEEALRLFALSDPVVVPQSTTDQRPFVRRLVAELREQGVASGPEPAGEPSGASAGTGAGESVTADPVPLPAGASAPRVKRRRWPWRRNQGAM